MFKANIPPLRELKIMNFYNLINAVKQEGTGAEGKGILPPGEDFTEEVALELGLKG